MNLFQVVFLNVVLLSFPILIFLMYLSTNKTINNKTKNLYLRLTLISSFFMLYNYGINEPILIPILVLNSIVIFSYLVDYYILANIFAIAILLLYNSEFNYIYFLLIIYIMFAITYIIKKVRNINNYIFVEILVFISGLIFLIWVYKYNFSYFNIQKIFSIIISYIFITNIFYMMYEEGKNILKVHLNYKELQREKQIRLSLFKITHEIKNPIAVCKGYLDMINVNDSKQVERFIPIIKSEIQRLLTLLQDFLLINKNNIDLDIMDFNMLIEDTIDKLDPLLKENNIKLNSNLLDDEIFINGDYNRLSQVIINMLKNSIEAIPNNVKGKISISSKIIKDSCILIIEDNGEGMNKDTLNKIKTPFFTTKRRGSGLGVSLIYEIVEAHNGKVSYESKLGSGTKVVIKLPICNSY